MNRAALIPSSNLSSLDLPSGSINHSPNSSIPYKKNQLIQNILNVKRHLRDRKEVVNDHGMSKSGGKVWNSQFISINDKVDEINSDIRSLKEKYGYWDLPDIAESDSISLIVNRRKTVMHRIKRLSKSIMSVVAIPFNKFVNVKSIYKRSRSIDSEERSIKKQKLEAGKVSVNISVKVKDLPMYQSNWELIERSVFHSSAIVPNPNFAHTCQCIGACTVEGNCECLQESQHFYDDDGVLKSQNNEALIYIVECSEQCSCNKNICRNRVVQKSGVNYVYKFELFKSKDCGWGVTTLSDIRPAVYLFEYIGEIVSEEEAEKRGKEYNENGYDNYLWTQGMHDLFHLINLDLADSQTIDATKMGNVSRFVNHSHSPNLVAYVVHYDCLDTVIPRIAIFSNRLIKAGEELTINYNFPISQDPNERVLCKCNADNCTGYLQ